jgi:hypothetical protein
LFGMFKKTDTVCLLTICAHVRPNVEAIGI